MSADNQSITWGWQRVLVPFDDSKLVRTRAGASMSTRARAGWYQWSTRYARATVRGKTKTRTRIRDRTRARINVRNRSQR